MHRERDDEEGATSSCDLGAFGWSYAGHNVPSTSPTAKQQPRVPDASQPMRGSERFKANSRLAPSRRQVSSHRGTDYPLVPSCRPAESKQQTFQNTDACTCRAFTVKQLVTLCFDCEQ
jgi:hypothetical protein